MTYHCKQDHIRVNNYVAIYILSRYVGSTQYTSTPLPTTGYMLDLNCLMLLSNERIKGKNYYNVTFTKMAHELFRYSVQDSFPQTKIWTYIVN